MTHVVTVWWERDSEGGTTKDVFTAPHVRSKPFGYGWQIELLDEEWRVFEVQQFRRVHRVSIEVKEGDGG